MGRGTQISFFILFFLKKESLQSGRKPGASSIFESNVLRSSHNERWRSVEILLAFSAFFRNFAHCSHFFAFFFCELLLKTNSQLRAFHDYLTNSGRVLIK